MLYGMIVRSPLAAAKIVSIDKRRALSVPGVVCVLGPDDVPERYHGMILQDEPLLARDRVRYVGEPVALIAAESKLSARNAAAELQVEYEPLPSVVNLEGAIAPDAPAVHEDQPNIITPASEIRRGDPDAVFAEPHIIVSTEVRSQRVHQGYIEPRVALAHPTDRGLEITTSTQAPFSVRQGVADLLDLSLAQLVVRAPAVGGGFGGKLQVGVAPYAAALALATSRPVQVVSTRAEELQASNPREGSLVRLESAVDADGKILARRAVVYVDAGAYAGNTPGVASVTSLLSTGPYAIGAVDARSYAVYTNTACTGAMRGPGAPQLMYATECHMEDVAERIGIDPLELRRRNLLRAGDEGPAGQPLEQPGMERCLEEVAGRLAEWRAEDIEIPPGHRRGYGLGCGWWFTGVATGSAAMVALNDDGTATLHTGATEIGTGAVVSGVTAIVADELGLSVDDVRLVSASTDEPYDVGSEGSRTMYGAGAAARIAGVEVAGILKHAVAEHLEASEADILLKGGRAFVAGVPDRGLSIAEAVALASADGPVIGNGRFFASEPDYDRLCVNGMFFGSFIEPTFHCHGAEVIVDEATGNVAVGRYVAAHDIGRMVNPIGVRGQIEGGVVQGIGYALYEEVVTDSTGRTVNDSFVDYRMPTAGDIPTALEIVVIEDYQGQDGPHGAKGVGEAPALLPAAAIGSAVRDAVGAQPKTLPISGPAVVALASRRRLDT